MGDQHRSAEEMLPALNQMIEAMAEAVIVIDRSGMVVAANRAAFDLFSVSDCSSADRSENSGKPYDRLIASWNMDDNKVMADELRRSLEGKSLSRQEATITTADGSEHVIEFTVSPIRDAQGQVMLGMMVASDVTAQHRIHAYWQAVATSAQSLSSDLSLEELLNTVLDEIVKVLGGEVVIGVWAVDETRKRLDIRAHRGLSEGTARRIQSLPLDAPSLICAAARTRKVLSTENTREVPPDFDLDRRLVEEEGLVSWIAAPLLSGTRLLGAISYGSRSPRHFHEEDVRTILAVSGLFGTALDHAFLQQEMQEINQRLLLSGVREQELAEKAARNTAQMNALMENQTEGVTIADSMGRIVMMNRAAQTMTGCSDEDCPQTLEDYRLLDLRRLNGSALPFEDWPLCRALRGERFEDQEVLLMSSSGTKRRVLYSGSAIREDDGKVALAITVHRDVTALRDLERVKEEYVATISHDLRNPLTAVMGHAQMLERQLGDMELAKEAKTAALILTSARRMNAMIRDLSESSRLESGTMSLEKEPADLSLLMNDIVERIGSSEDRNRLKVETTQWVPPLAVDHVRFERAAVNLITNALKFSPPNSPVLVRVGRADGEAVVSVIDSGDGITRDELPQLFERFHRAKTARSVDGLGLGLYITRLIVEAHAGRVWAESEPGKGSAFHIALPLEA